MEEEDEGEALKEENDRGIEAKCGMGKGRSVRGGGAEGKMKVYRNIRWG